MGYLYCYGELERCAPRIIMMPAVDRQSWKALKLGSGWCDETNVVSCDHILIQVLYLHIPHVGFSQI